LIGKNQTSSLNSLLFTISLKLPKPNKSTNSKIKFSKTISITKDQPTIASNTELNIKICGNWTTPTLLDISKLPQPLNSASKKLMLLKPVPLCLLVKLLAHSNSTPQENTSKISSTLLMLLYQDSHAQKLPLMLITENSKFLSPLLSTWKDTPKLEMLLVLISSELLLI